MTHCELVAVAAKWLQKKCSVVMTELCTSGESPDAIGWRGTHSILVECKVSRADFAADQQKFFRRNAWQGIGTHRYYMSPSGLLTPDDLPPKWGLLELSGSRVRAARESEIFDQANARQEIGLLLSALRRIGHTAPKGVSIKCYTIETRNTATLGVASEIEVLA